MKPIRRGDYRRIKVSFSRNGVAIDMTGGIVFFTMKKRPSTPYEQAELKKRVVGASPYTIIELQNEDTQLLEPTDYYYDIQFVDSERRPVTLESGKVAVQVDITEVIE